ncbi:paladin-like [Littorina saxatilis]|uniref:paladin-like n=1 Tax=Littorina saxatilis TaxID=31220 RepID=UPI0038B49DDF
MVRTNKVAPVIIKDCREEFQHISDLKDIVIYGSMGDNMPEHPLVKGNYFLVGEQNPKVDALRTLKEVKAPNFHKAQGKAPVYASGQPSVDGVKRIMGKLREEGHQDVFVFNLRQEPVLFLKGDDGDFLPHSLREQDKLRRLFLVNFSALEADEHEAAIRKEVLDLAALSDEKWFYFYSEPSTPGSGHVMEYQQKVLTVEDDLLTATEVYCRNSFAKPRIRTRRLCLPQNSAPSTETVDNFLAPFKENPRFLSSSVPDFPAVYFVCGTGQGRSTLGKAMGCLLYAHKMGFLDEGSGGSNRSPPSRNSSGRSTPEISRSGSGQTEHHNTKKSNWPGNSDQKGALRDLKAVQLLMEEIDNGWKIKKEVDWVVEQCSTLCGLSACVADTKVKLDSFPISNNIEADHYRDHLYQLCQEYTERYLFLIAFNAYLHDQFQQGLALSYSQWLERHPGIVCVMCNLDLSKKTEPASLVTSGRRCLVSDSYIGLDVLGSMRDVQVANFRRVMGLPVYGMAQPARDGLSRVVNYLLSKKQGYGEAVVVNLRNDIVIEFDEATYHVEDSSNLGEPVSVYGASGRDMEASEQALLKEIKGKKSVTVHEELGDPTVSKTPVSTFTPDDLWQQQRLQTLDMCYRRLPINYDHGFQEKEFGVIQQLMLGYMKTESSWKDNQAAFVFHCRTGKSRTSLAMAAASIVFFHMRGFPYGAKPGEQELVSCPNRSYTLGEFVVVMRLVRRLPDGYQRKREVDFVLDRLFETMSPMHFHLREVIFVTYNKIKSANCESIRERRRRQSLDFMERYIYLILYNTYIAEEKHTNFTRSFSHWMKEVASEAGAYDVLDNLDFTGLENPPFTHYRTRRQRWVDRHADVPFYGQYV